MSTVDLLPWPAILDAIAGHDYLVTGERGRVTSVVVCEWPTPSPISIEFTTVMP